MKKLPGKSVSVVGLRAEESPDRRFVMFGEDSDLFWMRRKKEPHKAYPIIDWSYTDDWKFLCDNKLKYNKIYDKMYMLGLDLRTMRVSNLIHEKAYRCLAELQELEPETYDKLEERLKGVHCAAIYARENLVYSIKKLPKQFKTWKEYKDFLLGNIHPDLAKIFRYQWTRFGDTDNIIACKYSENPTDLPKCEENEQIIFYGKEYIERIHTETHYCLGFYKKPFCMKM